MTAFQSVAPMTLHISILNSFSVFAEHILLQSRKRLLHPRQRQCQIHPQMAGAMKHTPVYALDASQGFFPIS